VKAFGSRDYQLLAEVTQFIYREARLQDEHRYEEWELLWTDDGIYWIPANGDDVDPETKMSIVYDNRSRISVRVRQLQTGKRHTQIPRSRLRRVISNVEITEETADELEVVANALIVEATPREERVWASKNVYRLRLQDGALKMARKKVVLVNNESALATLSFLI
jgi:3-phenylpropionate/cinnamic acid dioxygenase small subunit